MRAACGAGLCTSTIGIACFGDLPLVPGLPLSLLGLSAPGCTINIDALNASLTAINIGGTGTVSVTIPNSPSLSGGSLAAQSICLTLTNGAGLLVSNGFVGILGS